MDEAWNLTQLEKGKKNSKIRDRQPRDIEKEIVDRGEYSYKNNLRELIHLAINEGHPKNMEQFKKLLDIHLPLTDKSHERDGEQQDQRKEKRTRQGRIGVHQIFLSDIIAARQFIHAASLEKRLH